MVGVLLPALAAARRQAWFRAVQEHLPPDPHRVDRYAQETHGHLAARAHSTTCRRPGRTTCTAGTARCASRRRPFDFEGSPLRASPADGADQGVPVVHRRRRPGSRRGAEGTATTTRTSAAAVRPEAVHGPAGPARGTSLRQRAAKQNRIPARPRDRVRRRRVGLAHSTGRVLVPRAAPTTGAKPPRACISATAAARTSAGPTGTYRRVLRVVVYNQRLRRRQRPLPPRLSGRADNRLFARD